MAVTALRATRSEWKVRFSPLYPPDKTDKPWLNPPGLVNKVILLANMTQLFSRHEFLLDMFQRDILRFWNEPESDADKRDIQRGI